MNIFRYIFPAYWYWPNNIITLIMTTKMMVEIQLVNDSREVEGAEDFESSGGVFVILFGLLVLGDII